MASEEGIRIPLTKRGMLAILKYSQDFRLKEGMDISPDWEIVAMLDPEKAVKIPHVPLPSGKTGVIWDFGIAMNSLACILVRDEYGGFYLLSALPFNRHQAFQHIIYNMYEMTEDSAYEKLHKQIDTERKSSQIYHDINGKQRYLFMVDSVIHLLHECGFQNELLSHVDINGAEEIGQVLLAYDVFKRILNGEPYTDKHYEFLTKLMYNERIKLYDTTPSSLPKYVWLDDVGKIHKDLTSVWKLTGKMMKIEDGALGIDNTTILYNRLPHVSLSFERRISVFAWPGCPAQVGDIIEYNTMGKNGFCIRIVASNDDSNKKSRLHRIYG
jgi:hypothetical protein